MLPSVEHLFLWWCGSYFYYEEINVLLEEVIHLFLKDGLDFSLTVARHITWRLRHTPGNQCTTFICHLPGQVTGCLIDLRPLDQM